MQFIKPATLPAPKPPVVLPTSTSISWSDAVKLINACQVTSLIYKTCLGETWLELGLKSRSESIFIKDGPSENLGRLNRRHLSRVHARARMLRWRNLKPEAGFWDGWAIKVACTEEKGAATVDHRTLTSEQCYWQYPHMIGFGRCSMHATAYQ
jgi:hypothetical protein